MIKKCGQIFSPSAGWSDIDITVVAQPVVKDLILNNENSLAGVAYTFNVAEKSGFSYVEKGLTAQVDQIKVEDTLVNIASVTDGKTKLPRVADATTAVVPCDGDLDDGANGGAQDKVCTIKVNPKADLDGDDKNIFNAAPYNVTGNVHGTVFHANT